jgi:outer membrane protein assembly factor BamB
MSTRQNLKISLALILLSFLFTHTSLAVEPELVFELSIEGQIVMGSISDGNLILSTHEGLQVVTSDGKQSFQANLKPNQGLVTSADGKFFGITNYSKSTSTDFLSAESFALYSAEGNKLWEIKNPEVSDFHISNQANFVVGVSAGEGSQKSRLIFYNHAGDSIRSIDVELFQGISFSYNGKYVFVNSGKDGLLAYDDSGNLKGSLGLCEKFATSRDGEYVVTMSNGALKFFYQTKTTGISPKTNLLSAREMSFSPDNRYLSVVDKKSLYLFEVKTGKLLWQYTLDKPELSFVSVDVAGNAEKIITGIDFDKGRGAAPEERHTNGFVYLFDKEGRITWQKELSYKLWGAVFPQVQFSSDGTRFSVVTREKIYLFKNPL